MLPQTIINIFNKYEEERIETQSKMIMGAKWWLLYNDRNKLFNGKPILRVCLVLFIFVTLSSLAALFSLFPT